MFMQHSEEGASEDLNEAIATYIRLADQSGFQYRMRKTYKRPSGTRCSAVITSPTSMLTSSQMVSPKPGSVSGYDSFANYSLQGSESSGYMNVDAEDDDLELGDDADETFDSLDSSDHNNNVLTMLGSSYQPSGPVSSALPKLLPLANPHTPEKVLEKLNQMLNELKHQDLEEYLEISTKIIQLHLGHSVRLDRTLFKLIFGCIEPSYVNDIFNRGIIYPEDVHRIGCLYERNFLFSAIDLTLNGEHSYAFDVLMSLAVLIYKSLTSRCRRNLFTCLNRDFTSFVTSDIYEATKKSIGIKCFLRSLILTGVISNAGLNLFLSQHEPVDTSLDSDMESDSIAVFSSSDENSDDEHPNAAAGQPAANGQNRGAGHPAAAAGVSTRKTVAQFLNHIPNTANDLCNMLPLTLKHRCRIVIKECMPDFSLKQARKLKILPAELQDFVSFNDEVDRVLKLTKKLKTMPSMTP